MFWRIPWTEATGGPSSTGSQSWTRLSDFARSLTWQKSSGNSRSWPQLLYLPCRATGPPPFPEPLLSHLGKSPSWQPGGTRQVALRQFLNYSTELAPLDLPVHHLVPSDWCISHFGGPNNCKQRSFQEHHVQPWDSTSFAQIRHWLVSFLKTPWLAPLGWSEEIFKYLRKCRNIWHSCRDPSKTRLWSIVFHTRYFSVIHKKEVIQWGRWNETNPWFY